MNYSIISENHYLIKGIDNTMHSLKKHIPNNDFSMAFVDMKNCRQVMYNFDASTYDLIVLLTENEDDCRLFPGAGKSCYTVHIVASMPYQEFYNRLEYTLKNFSMLRSPFRRMHDMTTFTDIECKIIKMMADNQLPKSIALSLDIDLARFYRCRSKLMDKLNVKNLIEMNGKLQQLECYKHFLCSA